MFTNSLAKRSVELCRCILPTVQMIIGRTNPVSSASKFSGVRKEVSQRWCSGIPPSYRRTFSRKLMTRNRQKPKIDIDARPKPNQDVLAPELATKISLRSARADDCGDIIRLIYDFAEWEDSLDQVELTEEDLLRDGFGEMPFFHCVVAEAQDSVDMSSVIAYAMYNFCYCAWKGRMLMWEDIYVHQDYRGFGLGAILLHQVGKHAYERGCRRVAGYVDAGDPKLPQWYKNYGFVDFSEEHNYHIYSLSDDALDKFAQDFNPFEKPTSMGMDIESSI